MPKPKNNNKYIKLVSKCVNLLMLIFKKLKELVHIIYHKKPKPTSIDPNVAQPKKYNDASILPRELDDKFNIL